MSLRVATRGSALARWQAHHIASLLVAAHDDIDVDLVIVETTGDRQTDVPVWQMGGKGVFVKEVQAAVLDGRADLAVHSAKDLPSIPVDGLTIAAVPERGDPRDALVGATLHGLAPGATVATGSVRRRAQLADLRPDLTFDGLRGNIDTRLAKASAYGAVVMAYAALERLGLADRATEVLEPSVMVPQVGQGALAIEARTDDEVSRAALAAIDHQPSRTAVEAERAFLAELGGDCDLPAGAHARDNGDGRLRFDAVIASLDGRMVLRHTEYVSVADVDSEALGRGAAAFLLAHGAAAQE
jgi:hydroxymethylbilane synthase